MVPTKTSPLATVGTANLTTAPRLSAPPAFWPLFHSSVAKRAGVVGVDQVGVAVHDPDDAVGRAVGRDDDRAGQVAEAVAAVCEVDGQRAVAVDRVGLGGAAVAADPVDLAVVIGGGARASRRAGPAGCCGRCRRGRR